MSKNVILLTIDTLRRDVLGCYGNQDGISPFIDSIAKDSLVFKNNYTVAPYTQASFPGILTSSYFYDYEKSDKLSTKRTIIAESLKKNNVITAGFHSNPYLCDFFGWNRGWDLFYDSMQDQVTPMNPYIKGDKINKKVDNWLGNYKLMYGDKPFFIWAHYMDVHEPYIPDKKYIEQIDASISKTNEELFKLFKEVVLERDASDSEMNEFLLKLYKAHVIEIDEYTKGFFEVLNKHNLMDNTTVIITTDHGDEFGDHGSLSHDGKFNEELVHCPLIIVNQGQGEIDKLTSGVDISPTVVDLFGFDPEPNFEGASMLPLDRYPDKPIFGEAIGKLKHKVQPTDKPAYYMKDGNIKISYRVEDDKWEMYDLEADPGEKNNIIDSSPLAGEMKNKLKPRINRSFK